MDLNAVRTFVAAADTGRFQDAAGELSVTQQAVSKRIAALEKALSVRLFTRSARGAALTVDGDAFLPHARELLRAEDRAVASVRPGRRALRVDVVGRRLGPAALLGDFHRAHPATELDVVTLFDAESAARAILSGTIDASFRAVAGRGGQLPEGVVSARVAGEPLQLLTGPAHPLADSGTLAPADLAGHRIWMPGLVDGTEWAAYYADLASAFGLTIESTGPGFGTDPVLETIAGSGSLATLVGERTHLVWPAEHGMRRIPLRDPTPVYPHSLLWHRDNPHPALAQLRDELCPSGTRPAEAGTWTPDWAAK